ncbi:BrnT family toxin [Bradyrhizobium manausense]|uniref:BrnT family toxin n=1 Tax=Bradyrhizobium manausense TaxID=989370 RepID=UPI001BA4F9BD|nr:BrnT family toxin [Bradyrhizobium manausense]MBR1092469.1 BrnT family toxin [Bradyrhizobium manausense]
MEGFEWDPEKNSANRRKHGLSFEEAALIFEGPVLTGPDHSTDEVRDKSFGLLGGTVVICVIHTERNGKIRIISARKATASERKQFDVYLKKALG